MKVLSLIALLTISQLVSCGGDRPTTRYESAVSLDLNAPLVKVFAIRGIDLGTSCFSKPCKTVGCSAKPESISDVCEQLRSKYASSGRVPWESLRS